MSPKCKGGCWSGIRQHSSHHWAHPDILSASLPLAHTGLLSKIFSHSVRRFFTLCCIKMVDMVNIPIEIQSSPLGHINVRNR